MKATVDHRKDAKPGDPDPKWNEAGRVHDWRNHVPDAVKELWPTFTERQQKALEAWAEDLASAEEWE